MCAPGSGGAGHPSRATRASVTLIAAIHLPACCPLPAACCPLPRRRMSETTQNAAPLIATDKARYYFCRVFHVRQFHKSAARNLWTWIASASSIPFKITFCIYFFLLAWKTKTLIAFLIDFAYRKSLIFVQFIHSTLTWIGRANFKVNNSQIRPS